LFSGVWIVKKAILFGAAAAVLAASAPALAQPARGHGERIVTRADMQDRVRTNFMRVDANRDGFVTRAEAQAVADDRRGGRREARAERRENRGERRAAQFARLDANRDGMISRAEFSAPRSRGDRAELRQQRAERRADRMERRGRRGGGGFGLRAFERQDANRDGRLSLPEAIRARLARFERLDLNRDGRLTREERQRAREERRNRG
jgi:hypothetical protein